jgi:hypothetical protein
VRDESEQRLGHVQEAEDGDDRADLIADDGAGGDA